MTSGNSAKDPFLSGQSRGEGPYCYPRLMQMKNSDQDEDYRLYIGEYGAPIGNAGNPA